MKVYAVVHKRRELCTMLQLADAELVQSSLTRAGIETSIRVRGVSYRVWPDKASPPLLLVLNQPRSDAESGSVVRHALFNLIDTVIDLFKRIRKLDQ